jgi:hypothetical protein
MCLMCLCYCVLCCAVLCCNELCPHPRCCVLVKAFYEALHAEGTVSRFVPALLHAESGEDSVCLTLENAAAGFRTATRSVCDIKLGRRTWVEDVSTEVHPEYTRKFAAYGLVDPGGVGKSKRDYMEWRDASTSSTSLGFRVTGMAVAKGSGGPHLRSLGPGPAGWVFLICFGGREAGRVGGGGGGGGSRP